MTEPASVPGLPEPLRGPLSAGLGRAFLFARRVLGDAALAEDAVQEACLRYLRRPPLVAGPAEAQSYFLRVVHGVSVNMLKGELARARREGEVMNQQKEAAASPAREAQDREALLAARAEIERMPRELREAICLCCETGLTHREAAEVIGVPLKTMSDRVARGLDRLRRQLAASGFAALGAGSLAEVLSSGGTGEAPASLVSAVQKMVETIPAGKPAAVAASSGALKGGIIVKIGLGVAAAGLVAGGVFWAVGGKSEESAKPAPVAEKVPGKDFPYGADALYKREVLFGSFASGLQDGPGPQTELRDAASFRAPNGDWYILDSTDAVTIMKYDVRKGRTQRIGWGGPYGKRGGLFECARFGGGWYMGGMGLSVDPAGKYLNIHDQNNKGMLWRMSFETMVVEPSQAANSVKGAVVSASTKDGSMYFAAADGKLKKLLPDGKTIQDLGVALEQPCHGVVSAAAVSEKMGRLYAMNREHFFSPWGVCWYWDLKTGKAVPVAGYKDYQRKGEKPDPQYNRASGPAEKVGFWCASGISLGPDEGERYVYIGGGDESTFSIVDLEKKYVFKFVKKGGGAWGFGEGRQGKDYKFADPYTWSGPPNFGADGEFYISWPLASQMDVWRPVKK